jgi:hypothetical protein
VRAAPHTLLATLPQIEAAFDKLRHVDQGQTAVCRRTPNIDESIEELARSPVAVTKALLRLLATRRALGTPGLRITLLMT